MKIFISWSGVPSRAVAEALRDWLPKVIQSLRPWISSRDIPKGTRWRQRLAEELQDAKVGIICLTPTNLNENWILFEAGAMAKSLAESLVCTYLYGVRPAEIIGPLSEFQATRAEHDDTKGLLTTINSAL